MRLQSAEGLRIDERLLSAEGRSPEDDFDRRDHCAKNEFHRGGHCLALSSDGKSPKEVLYKLSVFNMGVLTGARRLSWLHELAACVPSYFVMMMASSAKLANWCQ